jgi:hypothetical protein
MFGQRFASSHTFRPSSIDHCSALVLMVKRQPLVKHCVKDIIPFQLIFVVVDVLNGA